MMLGNLVAAYLAFYILVSFAGKYTEGPVTSGETRIFDGAWAVRDQYVCLGAKVFYTPAL